MFKMYSVIDDKLEQILFVQIFQRKSFFITIILKKCKKKREKSNY